MRLTDLGQLSRRSALSLLLGGTASAALAEAPLRSLRPVQKPDDAARRAISDGDFYVEQVRLTGQVSYLVADANTGETLEALAPLKAHPPASVSKALTALYALRKLGRNHRFRTQLIATGPIEAGVIQGDLVLVGGGDPTLNADDLLEMAGRLKIAGVRELRGQFLVYDGALPWVEQIDDTQPIQVGYNPGLSGLNVNFNRVFMEWKRRSSGFLMTMDGRTETFRPEVRFASAEVADRGSPIFTYEKDGIAERWTVARGALGKGGGRWMPVRGPAIYAGDIFQTVARSHGLELPFPRRASIRPEGFVLAEHLSDPLEIICRDMLKFSTNITAEAIGLAASGADSLLTSGQEMSLWMLDQFNIRKSVFVDHSGLGDSTKLSAREMVRALNGPGVRGLLQPILKDVALRDAKGRPVENGAVKVVAKTGTLNFVSGLAGYLQTAGGRDLAFAIFASDLPRRRALPREARERPRGAKNYNGRAKRLQQDLLKRWAKVYEV